MVTFKSAVKGIFTQLHTSAHRVIFSLLGNKKRFTVIENVTLYLD